MINVHFDSLDEMLSFANRLATLGQKGPVRVPSQENPAATTTAPVQSAPVQQAPVQQAPAMITPVQTQPAQVAPTPQIPSHAAPVQQAPAQVQTTAQSYTMDDLTKAAVMLMDSGRQADLLNLLAQFGVEALPALPQEMYGAFATALRGLGAQI